MRRGAAWPKAKDNRKASIRFSKTWEQPTHITEHIPYDTIPTPYPAWQLLNLLNSHRITRSQMQHNRLIDQEKHIKQGTAKSQLSDCPASSQLKLHKVSTKPPRDPENWWCYGFFPALNVQEYTSVHQ